MESLVASLNSAKKLKAAGFPQRCHAKYRLIKDSGAELHHRRGTMNVFDIAAPTAQEIADQLPKILSTGQYLLMECNYEYVCGYAEYGELGSMYGSGDTMAEALALLWLKLQEGRRGS